MANITLLGASYTDVPAVDLPKTGGGTVRFYEDEPSDLTTKTITLNGTYDPNDDNADGYSEVTVNVANGASMTEVANTYGTELVITSAPGSAPSATRHTLYFEYEDETNETVYAYYDDALIGSAITATTPTTHNNKTVTSAQLDGVEWYSYTPEPTPSGNYETVWEGTVELWEDSGYIWDLADTNFQNGETWRVTINGTAYVSGVSFETTYYVYCIGNPDLVADTSATGGLPFVAFNGGGGAVKFTLRDGAATEPTVKLERQVSS